MAIQRPQLSYRKPYKSALGGFGIRRTPQGYKLLVKRKYNQTRDTTFESQILTRHPVALKANILRLEVKPPDLADGPG